jgi:hypothetical protein
VNAAIYDDAVTLAGQDGQYDAGCRKGDEAAGFKKNANAGIERVYELFDGFTDGL